MKKYLLTLLAGLSVLSADAQVSFRLTSEMPKTQLAGGNWHIQGWLNYDVSFFPVVECWTNFTRLRPAGSTASLSVALADTFNPGTYDLWVAMATQGTNLMVRANVGNGSVPDRTYGGTPAWTKLGTFTSSSSFSSVNLTTTKLFPTNISQNIWFGGVAVMSTNMYKLGTVNRWADGTPVPRADPSTIAPGNLVPNSSFEFGFDAHGWTTGRDGSMAAEPFLGNIQSPVAFHGLRSAPIGNNAGNARYHIKSPAIWLRGDLAERQYSLSFYYRRLGSAATSLTVNYGMVYTNSPGLPNPDYTARLTVTADWQRFVTNMWLKPQPNRLFQIDWSQVSINDSIVVDAVQFEEGPVATPYAPAAPIECNLTAHKNGNIFNVGDPRTIFVELFNSTASTSNVVFRYEVFDWMNRQVASGTNAFRSPVGFSSYPLTLNTTNTGISRVVAWVDGSSFSRPELVFSVAPLPTNPSLDLNSFFGTHAPAQRSAIESNFLWGFSWNRGLSPAGIVEWNEVQPTEGVWWWGGLDARVNANPGKSILLANLSASDDIPAWAMPNGVIRIDQWSNFVFNVVSRYKNQIRYWEDMNEPAWSAVDYAPILTATANAVKAADPTTTFVALGGIAKSKISAWLPELWNLLSAETKAKIDVIAVHGYPVDGDDTGVDILATARDITGKQVWNTESGVWGWGDYKGDRNGGPVGTVTYAEHANEFQFRRVVWQNPGFAARNWIRCMGRGMTKYFYYDARLDSYDWARESTNPTWFNYDDSLNNIGNAYFWSKYFIDKPTAITNPTNVVSDCMAFVFDRPSGATLAAFTRRTTTNYTATINSTAVNVYDLMGNLISSGQTSILISQVPTYWTSSTLTAAQLHNVFATASITRAIDTIAPSVSIDVSPHGLPMQKMLPLRMRWTAIDDADINTDERPAAVATRFRINGLTEWSDWTAKRTFDIDQIPSGVVYLEVQARDSAGNLSPIAKGPDFGLGYVPISIQAPGTPTGIVVQRQP